MLIRKVIEIEKYIFVFRTRLARVFFGILLPPRRRAPSGTSRKEPWRPRKLMPNVRLCWVNFLVLDLCFIEITDGESESSVKGPRRG